jgi:hypothetical protein
VYTSFSVSPEEYQGFSFNRVGIIQTAMTCTKLKLPEKIADIVESITIQNHGREIMTSLIQLLSRPNNIAVSAINDS